MYVLVFQERTIHIIFFQRQVFSKTVWKNQSILYPLNFDGYESDKHMKSTIHVIVLFVEN